MAVIKCKMCGGDLDISEGLSVCECEYCGTKQTVPTADNEKKLTLFARANRLRLANEFDKAAGVYETIVADFPEEAEAYWGLVLCRYGIEYVDDPATGKKVPTCHRSSFDSVMEDVDFEQACENADAVARRQYREEAKAIEDIRRGIIEVSGKEAPYDVFICYKETDENGDRTIDSVIAQDVYDALMERGYRVFFSRISLEDKLGTEYEPYIFAALNSAKLMLAFGTDYEYYNAVWVKNEWSRFLKLMEKDKTKHLIPCYKGIDAYDMPKEFHRLQAQDMGKVGAIQDLLRGIEKLLPRKESQPAATIQTASPSAPLTTRGMLFLEDGDFARADEYFERALDADPQNSAAYLGKFLAALHTTSLEDATKRAIQLEGFRDFSRALQFASPQERERLEQAAEQMTKQVLLLDLMFGLKHLIQKRTDAERRERELRDAVERTEREQRELVEKRKLLKPIRDSIKPVSKLIAAEFGNTVGLRVDGTVIAVGDNAFGQCNVTGWRDVIAIAASDSHTVGLRADGTILAVGCNDDGQCDVGNWSDIVAITTSKAGEGYTVGVRADGKVLATGYNAYGRCNVSDWRDITAIEVVDYHTVGICADGSVMTVGQNADGRCDTSDWRSVIAVTADGCTVGLRSDGTVLAVGNNKYGQCNVNDWRDIVAIAAGEHHTVGLRSDGTVLAVGDNTYGQCSVSGWRDIMAIATSEHHTVGLRVDGAVLAVGDNRDGQCNVSDWREVVAIAAGWDHTVGLRSDGTVLAVGNNSNGQCDVSDWKLFNSLDMFEQEYMELIEQAARERRKAEERAELERRAEAERAEQERKIAAERAEREAQLRREAEEKARLEREHRIAELNAEQAMLKTELNNLKGLFTGKRRKEIEARLAEINAELKKLQ